MLTAVFFLMTLAHLAFLILGIRLWQRQRTLYLALVAFIYFGLFYDNLMVGIGRLLGEGEPLRSLSWWRFVIHALFTPTLILYTLDLGRQFNIGWTKSRLAFVGLGLLMLGLIWMGVQRDIIELNLMLVNESGTLRYTNDHPGGPPIPAIVTIIVMIIIGAFIWRRRKWSALLVGAVLMFVFAGAGATILVLSNIGEVFLAGSLICTDLKLEKLSKQEVEDSNLALAS